MIPQHVITVDTSPNDTFRPRVLVGSRKAFGVLTEALACFLFPLPISSHSSLDRLLKYLNEGKFALFDFQHFNQISLNKTIRDVAVQCPSRGRRAAESSHFPEVYPACTPTQEQCERPTPRRGLGGHVRLQRRLCRFPRTSGNHHKQKNGEKQDRWTPALSGNSA